MDRRKAVIEHYSHINEDLRFSSRAGSVEFLTSVHYIEKYLKPGDRIIEIGAASGRYSHYFARKGYEVDAIELVMHNIELFRENTQPGEKVAIRQGDAVDLEGVPSDAYDVTLLLGPMYHLFSEEESRAAISEAIRVTRPGGVIFAAYITNDFVVYDAFNRGLFESGMIDHTLDPESFRLVPQGSATFSFRRKEEIDDLMKGFEAERLHYVGTDMLTYLMRDEVDSMSDDMFDMYMRYILSACERADCVGLSCHTLDIFRKL